jgi:hypothetical protein
MLYCCLRIPATVSQPDSESPGPSRILSNLNCLKTRTHRRLELTPRASSLEHRRRDPGRRNVPGPLAESIQTTQCCRTGLSVSLSHTLTDRDRDSHRVTPQAARPRPGRGRFTRTVTPSLGPGRCVTVGIPEASLGSDVTSRLSSL